MNVLDHLKNKTVEEIKEYVSTHTFPAAAAMMHIEGDFNLATVVRNANFFGLEKVYYIGGKRGWDRRGAVGTQNYTPVEHCHDESEFFDKINGLYSTVAIECNTNYESIELNDFDWPLPPVMIFGEEQKGLSDSVLERCAHIVHIGAHGSVRSLNVGTTSGIVMNNFVNNGMVLRELARNKAIGEQLKNNG